MSMLDSVLKQDTLIISTLIFVIQVLALIRNPNSISQDIKVLLLDPLHLSKLLVILNPYQFVLTQAIGLIMQAESLINVLQTQAKITLFYLLVMLPTITSLKTHGVFHGVKKDISESPVLQTIAVVLQTPLFIQLYDYLCCDKFSILSKL